MEGTVTPLPLAEQALRASTGEALLDMVEQLTHQIHALRGPDCDVDKVAAKVAMRGMCRAELLRRLGEQR